MPGGGNVLYMDGHVEYLKYKSKYPFSVYVAVERPGSGGDPAIGANFLQYYTEF